MLPADKVFSKFPNTVTFWICVPSYGPRRRFHLHITVLVKPETSALCRQQIRRALNTAYTPNVLRKMSDESDLAHINVELEPNLVVHIKSGKVAR
jgi:hypothetical protein